MNELRAELCGASLEETGKEKCPVCNENGQKVKRITVENIVKEEHQKSVSEDHFFLCLSADCEVVYFNDTGDILFTKNMVKVPVWFKEKESPKPVCYCKEVSDTTILKHVVELGHHTLEEIQKYTGANTGKECLIKNPNGR